MRRLKPLFIIAVCVVFVRFAGGNALAQKPKNTAGVLIATPKPYDQVVAGIKALGGTVKIQYNYIDAIAAEIPTTAVPAVQNLVGPNATILDDKIVPHPSASLRHRDRKKEPGGFASSTYNSIQAITSSGGINQFASSNSGAYLLNMADVALAGLHSRGFVGTGVNVAVIDTGIVPGFPSIGNSVIGGVDFVGDGNGFSNPCNDGHGTFVASLITGQAVIDLKGSADDPLSGYPLLSAIQEYAPGALINGHYLAILGSAPSSGIYAVRVFGSGAGAECGEPGAGSPESVVLQGIEDVITLRTNYNNKKSGGLKIDVANMSFGETTLDAGHGLLDQEVDALLAAGIIPVAAAGDAGPATLTIASPASSFSAIAVGAASYAKNERIYNDLYYGQAGYGALYRPFDGTQTAQFSARGPNADGRKDPKVLASGLWNFGQGLSLPTEVDLASGTSFSAPIVSGVAAILRQEFPNATATQIRNAILAGAVSSVISDGSGVLDYGNGVVNAQNASDLLATNQVSGSLPSPASPTASVAQNVENGTNLNVVNGNVKQSIKNLEPGQRSDILYDIAPGTTQTTIALTNVNPALSSKKQNQLFGDDVFFMIHSAKTSAIGVSGDYYLCGDPRDPGANTCGFYTYPTPGTIVVNNPEPGIIRISVNGDTTNAGNISADVSISSNTPSLPTTFASGTIANGATTTIPVTIPAATNVQFILSFNDDWSHYPTSDIDMVITDPKGNVDYDGETLNAPESALIGPQCLVADFNTGVPDPCPGWNGSSPNPGSWQIQILGTEIPAGSDKYQLTVIVDGKVMDSKGHLAKP